MSFQNTKCHCLLSFCDFWCCVDWLIKCYQTWHHISEGCNINNEDPENLNFMSSYLLTNTYIFKRGPAETHPLLPCILHCLPNDTCASVNSITTTFNCLQKDTLSQNSYKEQLKKTILVPPVKSDTEIHTDTHIYIYMIWYNYVHTFFTLHNLKNKKKSILYSIKSIYQFLSETSVTQSKAEHHSQCSTE